MHSIQEANKMQVPLVSESREPLIAKMLGPSINAKIEFYVVYMCFHVADLL